MILPRTRQPVLNHRYRLLERVGAGGSATVYRAQDLAWGGDVAVKILHDGLASDKAFAERFRREASVTESLQHKGIVRAFEHGVDEGAHYIAMEHVKGRTLKTIIAAEAPLTSARAVDITLQILEATRFIHARGIIHCDLKPGNVLVRRSGLLKLADFAVACVEAAELTTPGAFFGTIEYSSPERVMGEAASERSDLYSVGVILYELLTGRLPFNGDTVATVALKHVEEQAVCPSPRSAAARCRISDAESRSQPRPQGHDTAGLGRASSDRLRQRRAVTARRKSLRRS